MALRRPAGSTSAPISMGIDIGSQMAKLILLEGVGERVDVVGASSYEIPAGSVADGVVIHPSDFGHRLAVELAQLPKYPTRGVFSIPSNLAALRWTALPKASEEERRDAARFKVKRHLPLPVDQCYVAVPPLDEATEDEHGQSMVIAVPRRVVDSRAEALEAAGVAPFAAELEAQAILRVVERHLSERGALWRDASLTIIDVGVRNTHMYVVQGQRLQFIRGVKFGSDLIARTVAESLEVEPAAAHDLLGLPESRLLPSGMLETRLDGSIAVVNVQPALEKLTREFMRLLRYFRSLHPERSYAGILDRAIACGGLVGLKGFCDYLEACLSLKVERARPFAETVAQFSLGTFQSVSSRQEAFTVVMGLALAGLQSELTTAAQSHVGQEYAWIRSG